MGHVQELFGQYESYIPDMDGDATELEAAAVLAHPDDEAIINALIAEAQRAGIPIHGVTLNKGMETTKNFLAHEGFDPQRGDRVSEAKAGADGLGFVSHEQLDGTDGDLERDLLWQIDATTEILVDREVDLVFSTVQMGPGDSYDHTTAGKVAVGAASRAAHVSGRQIGVVIAQPGGQGEWFAESSDEGLVVVRKVTSANRSQFRVEPTDTCPDDWIPLADGFSMHPKDWAELGQYPIGKMATYSLVKCGRLLMPQLVEF